MSMSKTIQFVAFTFACMVILACEPDFPNSAKSSSGFAFDYYSPQWSPNDGSILFGYGKSLYKVESNGGSLDTIYKWRKGKFETAQSPHISPDGTRIAYSTFDNSAVVPFLMERTDYRWEVATSDLDGGGRHSITKFDERHGRTVNPIWSPDGTRIAFISDHESMGSATEGPSFGVYTMSPDGSDLRRLAPSLPAKHFPPAWSPDGSHIAFLSGSTRPFESGELYVVKVNGATSPNRIGEAILRPTWSPDGRRIAFVRDEDGEYSIYTGNIDGTELTKVFAVPNPHELLNLVTAVSWSPDGGSLLFSGTGLLGLVDADGSNARHLIGFDTRNFRRKLYASWSHDGSRIAVYQHDIDISRSDALLFIVSPDGLGRRVLVKVVPEETELGERLRPAAAQGEMLVGDYFRPPGPITRVLPFENGHSQTAMLEEAGIADTQEIDGIFAKTSCLGYSEESCSPMDVSQVDLFLGSGGSAAPGNADLATVEDVLEKGFRSAEISPVHIVTEGTGQQNTLRCAWRGVARTSAQRDTTIRFWLGKDDDDPLPSAAQAETEFMSYINQMDSRYQELVKAMFIPIARGGLSEDLLTLTCYVDYVVGQYILGEGSTELTLAYETKEEARSYDLYSRAHAAGEFGSEALMTEATYEQIFAFGLIE